MGSRRRGVCSGRVFLFLFTVAGTAASATGQRVTPVNLSLKTGQQVYQAACVACHGPDGKGMPDTTVGFQKPSTFPDFTQCSQTTPELNRDWKATIRDGGAGRGFSRIMPAFGEVLNSKQLEQVVKYLR